jgi:hypothetical protein
MLSSELHTHGGHIPYTKSSLHPTIEGGLIWQSMTKAPLSKVKCKNWCQNLFVKSGVSLGKNAVFRKPILNSFWRAVLKIGWRKARSDRETPSVSSFVQSSGDAPKLRFRWGVGCGISRRIRGMFTTETQRHGAARTIKKIRLRCRMAGPALR